MLETPLESQRNEHADFPPTFTIFPRRPFFIKAGEQWEIVLNVSTNQRRFNPYSDNVTWVNFKYYFTLISVITGSLSIPLKKAPMGTEGIRHYATSKGSFHLEFGEDAAIQRGHHWRSCLDQGQLPFLLFWPALTLL